MIRIDADKIHNADSFHAVFDQAFGFPGYYGENMNAWIDCMFCLDDPDSGLTTAKVEKGQVMVLLIENAQSFKTRCPDIFDSLIECAGFVNYQRIENNYPAILCLAFNI